MNNAEKIVAQQQKLYYQKKYVNYKKEGIIHKITKKELEETLDSLIGLGYKQIEHTVLKAKILPKTYCLTHNDRLIKLSYYNGKNYFWLTTNFHDDAKNIETPNSFRTLRGKFKQRTGIRLLEAYGRTKQEFKVFCPKPLYFISNYWQRSIWIKNVCKEDYSSHYPWSATGLLPDASTSMNIPGYVKPDEEYQFAFYPDTGHVAVFNEFDSHEWIEDISVYSASVKQNNFEPNYSGSDKRTILMKASQYKIEDEIMHFYNIKCKCEKDSEDYYHAKIFLLKFIGMMEQCNPKLYQTYPYAHLAAVIKWRANIKMFKTLRKIGFRNVIQVCVDGIIHSGDPIGRRDSGLGSLNIEATGCQFIQRGINQYILKNDVFKEVKHAGLDINIDSENIDNWLASEKVNFIEYMKKKYKIEEIK